MSSTVDPDAGFALAFGAGEDAVARTRADREGGLSSRGLLAILVVGVPFLVTAMTLVALAPDGPRPWLGAEILVVLAYALVARVEFEVGAGSYVPTQLVLWPMLFVFPLAEVPLLTLGGLLVAGLIDCATGRQPLSRLPICLVSAWHVLGPVVVLWLAGAPDASWSKLPLFAGALAAQFLVEGIALAIHERIADGTSPRLVVGYLRRSQAIDLILAPVGLAFAIAANGRPETVLLALPLAALLDVLSRERRARIDSALELSAAYRGTALLLGNVVEADDAYTGLHSRDVVELSVAVADGLALAPDDRRDTELVALLHDVGKIRVPEEIINKPGKLTPDEWAVMRMHTIEGERMLQQVGGLLAHVGSVVRSCHERWDGQGYPDGMAGAEIPIVARIVMCCDAYSAMTTDRSYRRALSAGEAVSELRAHAGTQFDPAVVTALVSVVENDAVERPSS